MSGFDDPYSGFFGEPGAWNWPVFCWLAFAAIIATLMVTIFIGFDNGGFLHRLERRFGIYNVDDPEDIEY